MKPTEVHQVRKGCSCRKAIPAVGRSGYNDIPVDVRQRSWSLHKDVFRYLKAGDHSREHHFKVMSVSFFMLSALLIPMHVHLTMQLLYEPLSWAKHGI